MYSLCVDIMRAHAALFCLSLGRWVSAELMAKAAALVQSIRYRLNRFLLQHGTLSHGGGGEEDPEQDDMAGETIQLCVTWPVCLLAPGTLQTAEL
jgi:hypothetical protein